MDQENSESVGWLDKLAAINAQLEKTPNANRASLAKTLNFSETVVAYLTPLRDILDQAAVEKIRLAAKGDRPFVLSFKAAHLLARLKGKVPDLTVAANDALDQILSHRMKKRHIAALVNHIAGGKPAKDFDPSTVKNRRERPKWVAPAPKADPLKPPVPSSAMADQEMDSTEFIFFGRIGRFIDDALDWMANHKIATLLAIGFIIFLFWYAQTHPSPKP